MKLLTKSFAIFILLTLAGCGNQKNSAPAIDLHTAVVTGDLAVVQQHIKAGSDLNIKEPTRQSTPLLTAIVLGKTDIALTLIDAGADINYQNNDGSTALITAAFFCHTDVVKALLDKNADTSLRNNAGHTALESVARPFEEVKGIYDTIGASLAPLGLKLDYERIKQTRPIIAKLLR